LEPTVALNLLADPPPIGIHDLHGNLGSRT